MQRRTDRRVVASMGLMVFVFCVLMGVGDMGVCFRLIVGLGSGFLGIIVVRRIVCWRLRDALWARLVYSVS